MVYSYWIIFESIIKNLWEKRMKLPLLCLMRLGNWVTSDPSQLVTHWVPSWSCCPIGSCNVSEPPYWNIFKIQWHHQDLDLVFSNLKQLCDSFHTFGLDLVQNLIRFKSRSQYFSGKTLNIVIIHCITYMYI